MQTTQNATYMPTGPDPDVATLDWLYAEAVQAHLSAKAYAEAAHKPTPQGALRLAAQLHHRRMLLTGRVPAPAKRQPKKEQPAADARTAIAELEAELGVLTPPASDPIAANAASPTSMATPIPLPRSSAPVDAGASAGQPLSKVVCAPIAHSLPVGTPPRPPHLSRQQRRAQARQAAKALKRGPRNQ
jgi:hypothetical protein